MKGIRFLILGIAAFFLVLSCGRFRVEAPEGFAEVKRQGIGRFLAVSPEGVKFGIRRAKNYPRQDLEYWRTAMGEHMKKAGYALVEGPEEFQTRKSNGVYFKWGAPYQGKDYIYFTGLIVSGRRLIIIEVGGEVDVMNSYHEAIIESINSMSP